MRGLMTKTKILDLKLLVGVILVTGCCINAASSRSMDQDDLDIDHHHHHLVSSSIHGELQMAGSEPKMDSHSLISMSRLELNGNSNAAGQHRPAGSWRSASGDLKPIPSLQYRKSTINELAPSHSVQSNSASLIRANATSNGSSSNESLSNINTLLNGSDLEVNLRGNRPMSVTSTSTSTPFKVNVSNICERDRMQITVTTNKPFFGLIHAKDKRKRTQCSLEGNGNQVYGLQISYTQVQSDADYCGVVAHYQTSGNNSTGSNSPAPYSNNWPPTNNNNNNSNHSSSSSNLNNYTNRASSSSNRKELDFSADFNGNSANRNSHQQQILSLILVVRLHKTIEFSEDKFFLLSCSNRCTNPKDCSSQSARSSHSSNQNQALITQTTNGHQHLKPEADSNRQSNQLLMTSDSSIVSRFRSSQPEEPTVTTIARSHVRPHILATGTARPLDHGNPSNWLGSSMPLANGNNNNNNNNSPQEINSSNYLCDPQLDAKFQWLARLCLILCLLMSVISLVALYLWLELRRRRRHASISAGPNSNKSMVGGESCRNRKRMPLLRKDQSSSRKSSSPDLKQRKVNSSSNHLMNDHEIQNDARQTMISTNWYEQPLVLHAQNNSPGHSTDGGTTNSSYIIINNNNKTEPNSDQHFNSDAIHHQYRDPMVQHEYKPAEVNSQLISSNQIHNAQQTSGYSFETFGRQAARPKLGQTIDRPNRGRQASQSNGTCSSLVRRRRSIGASIRAELRQGSGDNGLPTPAEQPVLSQVNGGFLPGDREKSKSQVTIHYEQQQDPFKAIPFKFDQQQQLQYQHKAFYVANLEDLDGNHVFALSDPETSNNTVSYRSSDHRRLPVETSARNLYQTENAPASDQQQQHQHQLPRLVSIGQQTTNQFSGNGTAIHASPKVPDQPSARLVYSQNSALDQSNLKTMNHASSTTSERSQFDPRNSRKLIDLIQQKHDNQLAQANLTASSLNLRSVKQQHQFNGMVGELAKQNPQRAQRNFISKSGLKNPNSNVWHDL